jgi:hypothetical protein
MLQEDPSTNKIPEVEEEEEEEEETRNSGCSQEFCTEKSVEEVPESHP